MGEPLTLYAVGDVAPRRNDLDFPRKEPLFAMSAPVTRQADIAFCQLEVILSNKPNRAYWNDVVSPDNVNQLIDGGFNVISLAGNHHMDAGVEAFVDTMDTLKGRGIKPVGVGMNIAEARTAAIIDKKGTRVAFLGYSSIIPKSEIPYDAEAERPGCAPMYVSTIYEASDWQPGTPSPRVITLANEEDLEAMKADVKRARAQADIVVVSFHWGVHHVPGLIAMYQFEVGHAAIDAGADLILGHHAHILKGIEVYKSKVIFYSLGNFAWDTVVKRRVIGRWDAPFRAVRAHDPNITKSMMAKCLIRNRQIEKVAFMPFLINQQGQPEPLAAADKRAGEVRDYLAWCCQDQHLPTRFVQEGNDWVIVE